MVLDINDVLKIILAMLIGLIIGAEREYKNKSAGLRTLMLVSVGSCIFTILSHKIGLLNPDRLAANIITGIGFLGAGAIFKDENKINGLTTATTIWITASLGMCIGFGYYFTAIFGVLVVISVLSVLVFLESFIDKKNRLRMYKIVVPYQNNILLEYENTFKNFQLKAIQSTQIKSKNEITSHWKVSGSVKNHQKLITCLLNDVKIIQLEF